MAHQLKHFLRAPLALLFVCLLALTGGSARAGAGPIKSIVLVHGAFADGSSWDRIVPLLEAKGYTVVAVQNPLTTLADDVAATRRAIESVPGPVLLVGHSWGGAVITEAGNHEKVAGLVYVAAFGPADGESLTDLGKGHPEAPWVSSLKVDSGGFARLPPETVRNYFAQDLSAKEARVLAAKQSPTALALFGEKITTAAWKHKPSWYVRAEQDRIIDPNAEAAMAKRMGATTTTVKGSHVVMLSKPRKVAAIILDAAAKL